MKSVLMHTIVCIWSKDWFIVIDVVDLHNDLRSVTEKGWNPTVSSSNKQV